MRCGMGQLHPPVQLHWQWLGLSHWKLLRIRTGFDTFPFGFQSYCFWILALKLTFVRIALLFPSLSDSATPCQLHWNLFETARGPNNNANLDEANYIWCQLNMTEALRHNDLLQNCSETTLEFNYTWSQSESEMMISSETFLLKLCFRTWNDARI